MDCDMRNPSVAGLLGMPPQQFGVYEYLTGEALLDAVKCQYSRYPLLTVLPGSKHVGNTQEVLNGQKIHDLIVNLKKEYDYIIIDTPPINIVSDALLFNGLINGYILSTRADQSDINSVGEAVDSITRIGAEIYGFVLSDLKLKGGSGNYGNYSKYTKYSKYSRYSAYMKEVSSSEE